MPSITGAPAADAQAVEQYYRERLEQVKLRGQQGAPGAGSPTAGSLTRAITSPGAGAPPASIDRESAQAILEGRQIAPAPAAQRPDDTQSRAIHRGPVAPGNSGPGERGLPAPDSGDCVGLEILWPPRQSHVVAPPSIVRFAHLPEITPRYLMIQRSDGETLLKLALAGGAETQLYAPELAVMVDPGQRYLLRLEGTDRAGNWRACVSDFSALQTADRRRLQEELTRLHKCLGPRWNEKEGLMFRAMAFVDFDCPGEAVDLLLRYRSLDPQNKDVHYMLSYCLREMDQPQRADAALALASATH